MNCVNSQSVHGCFERRDGFTLIEVIASTAIASIIFMAIGSAMVLTARAVPQSHEADLLLQLGQAMDELHTDLQLALAFQERSPTTVQFTVPDRTGNGQPDTIRYAWSGSSGAPLTRQFNNGAVHVIAANVQQFNLDYTIEHEQTVTSTTWETSETLLASHTGSLLLYDFPVNSSNWPGQYIEPDLPNDALSWSVTRVIFSARSWGPIGGSAPVQLRPPRSDRTPHNAVMEFRTLPENILSSSYIWVSAPYYQIQGLSPRVGVCFTIVYDGSGSQEVASVRHRGNLLGLVGTHSVSTVDSGKTWSASPTDSMLFYMYGTIKRPGPNVTTHTYRVSTIGINLQLGERGITRSAVAVLNQPEVPSP